MRTFVLRARAAPTDAQALLAGVGGEPHTEILAHTLMNAIFVAQSHRDDVVLHLVLESTPDYSRTVSFVAAEMGDIGGFHEQALLAMVARALAVSAGLGKEQERAVAPGIRVRTLAFDKLIQELSDGHALYVMDPKGEPIGDAVLEKNPCFILTDHIPMPKKNSLKRLGAQKLSLGPRMLFASQCVVLLHHRLDTLAE